MANEEDDAIRKLWEKLDGLEERIEKNKHPRRVLIGAGQIPAARLTEDDVNYVQNKKSADKVYKFLVSMGFPMIAGLLFGGIVLWANFNSFQKNDTDWKTEVKQDLRDMKGDIKSIDKHQL